MHQTNHRGHKETSTATTQRPPRCDFDVQGYNTMRLLVDPPFDLARIQSGDYGHGDA